MATDPKESEAVDPKEVDRLCANTKTALAGAGIAVDIIRTLWGTPKAPPKPPIVTPPPATAT